MVILEIDPPYLVTLPYGVGVAHHEEVAAAAAGRRLADLVVVPIVLGVLALLEVLVLLVALLTLRRHGTAVLYAVLGFPSSVQRRKLN